MPLHDLRYQHWEGAHEGIWRRRGVIAANGLKACLRSKWMRHLLTLAWGAALVQVAFLFLIGQLLVTDSVIWRWLSNIQGPLQVIAKGLVVWLGQNPQISVRCTQNVLFYYYSTSFLPLSLVALALAIPHLITRDLSSNAIIIYSSKAVSRWDYFLGKLGTLFGLMSLTWLGPLCAAWFFGNLLAPDWRFFWHSRMAIGHALLYGLSTTFVLSVLALGISALSGKEKTAVAGWIGLWLLGNALVPIAAETKPWLKFLSFTYDLRQIAYSIFQVHLDLKLAQDNIPLLGDLLRQIPRGTFTAWEHPELMGALLALGLMAGLAALWLAWRVKPE